jgi:hypothetical protein
MVSHRVDRFSISEIRLDTAKAKREVSFRLSIAAWYCHQESQKCFDFSEQAASTPVTCTRIKLLVLQQKSTNDRPN